MTEFSLRLTDEPPTQETIDMACFTAGAIEQWLIWIILLAAVVAIIKILATVIMPMLGSWGGVIAQVLNIVMWAIIAIAVVVFAFELIGCLIHSMPR